MNKKLILLIAICGVLGGIGGVFGAQLADQVSLAIILPAALLCFAGLGWFVIRNLSGNVKAVKIGGAEKLALLATPPPNGHAALVVFREGFVAKAVGMDVKLDGARLAQLKSPASVRLLLPAGQHEVSVEMPRAAAAAATTLRLTQGETVFLQATVELGMMKGRLALGPPADAGAARRAVEKIPMVTPLADPPRSEAGIAEGWRR